ncbi:MAG: tetratricopeptide repeat protein [Acidobacteria bacterium]|nr:tetratricopeptide repeat protein [Acidobacteriota bacterium]
MAATDFVAPIAVCLLILLIAATKLYKAPLQNYTRLQAAAVQALRDGDYTAAEASARQALAVAPKLRDRSHQPVLTAAVLLTSALTSLRRWEDALTAARHTIRHVPAAANADDATGLAALHKCCAVSLLELARLPEAIEAAQQCARRAQQGNETARVLHMEVEAEIASHQGDYRRMLDALHNLEASASATPYTQHTVWLRHATAYLDTGHPARAIPLFDKALAIPDSDPIEHAALLNLKGRAFDELEQHELAVDMHREALQLIGQHLPEGDPRIALPHILLGQSYADSGQIAAASASLAAAEQYESQLDETERHALLQLRGMIAFAAGQYADAEANFRQSLHWAEQRTNPNHPRLLHTLANLAATLMKQGRTDEAAALEARRQSIRNSYPDLI